MKQKLVYAVSAIFAVSLGIIYILDARNITSAIGDAIDICLYTICPSLFGYMFVGSFLVRTGLSGVVFKPLYFLFGRLFRFTEEEFSIFVLSLVGGYPLGARLTAEYIPDTNTRAKFRAFCYCPSPPFIIGVIGYGVFGSQAIGVRCWLCCVFGCVCYALFTRRNAMPVSEKTPLLYNTRVSDAIIKSVNSAGVGLFYVSAMIVFFSTVKEALRCTLAAIGLNLPDTARQIIFSLLEISSVKNVNAAFNPEIIFIFCAALSSFGGLCVAFQVLSLSGGGVNTMRFFGARLASAMLAAFAAAVSLEISPIIPNIRSVTGIIFSKTGSPYPSIALLAMCLLVCIGEKQAIPKPKITSNKPSQLGLY